MLEDYLTLFNYVNKNILRVWSCSWTQKRRSIAQNGIFCFLHSKNLVWVTILLIGLDCYTVIRWQPLLQMVNVPHTLHWEGAPGKDAPCRHCCLRLQLSCWWNPLGLIPIFMAYQLIKGSIESRSMWTMFYCLLQDQKYLLPQFLMLLINLVNFLDIK